MVQNAFKIEDESFYWVTWRWDIVHIRLYNSMMWIHVRVCLATSDSDKDAWSLMAATSEPHGKITSRLSDLDEVDVASMSCPEQLYVHYNSSIIIKTYIVIVVFYD